MKKFWLPLLPILILGSCYFPPYREELSIALQTTKKMEEIATVGPIYFNNYDIQRDLEYRWDIVFYPSKDALRNRTYDFVRGFIVGKNENQARLLFVDNDLIDYRVEWWNEFPIRNIDEKDFLFRATTIIDGSDLIGDDERIGFVVFDDEAEPKIREYFVYDQQIAEVGYFGFGGDVLGASFFHDYSPTDRVMLNTLRIMPGDVYSETEQSVDTGGLGGEINIRPADFPMAGLPKDIDNCFYYNLPVSISTTRRSYLSVYDAVRREYRNFSWDDSYELQVLTKIDRRIDMVLSNGWLYSRDENKSYVYDGEGELLNSFALGGLTLVYELYDGSIYRVVFTIPVWAPVRVDYDYWEQRLHFLVYWIPTEQLAEL